MLSVTYVMLNMICLKVFEKTILFSACFFYFIFFIYEMDISS